MRRYIEAKAKGRDTIETAVTPAVASQPESSRVAEPAAAL